MSKGRVKKAVGCLLAVAALGGALYYYNFVDKAAETGVKVGNKCVDFTAQTYAIEGTAFTVGEEEFALAEKIGKVCVINFWGITCQPCVEELSDFNALQEEYEGKVEILAVAGSSEKGIEDALGWLNRAGWSTWDTTGDWTKFSLTFGYMPTEKCKSFGVQALPHTVIVDKSGVVTYTNAKSLHKEELKELIEDALNH